MLIGIIIGVGGFALVAIAYANRNELDDRPHWRRLLPYAAALTVVVICAVVVAHIAQGGGGVRGTPPSPP